MQGTDFGRARDKVAAHGGPDIVYLAGRSFAVPRAKFTGIELSAAGGDDPVSRPHNAAVEGAGNQVVSPPLLPERDIIGGDVSEHVRAAAGAATDALRFVREAALCLFHDY